jgi:hypothetical protein
MREIVCVHVCVCVYVYVCVCVCRVSVYMCVLAVSSHVLLRATKSAMRACKAHVCHGMGGYVVSKR